MDKMKTYKSIVNALPQNTIIFSYGRFNPISIGHSRLIDCVKNTATRNNADYVIALSKTQDTNKNPLDIDRKLFWANKFFKDTNFIPATDRTNTIIDFLKILNRKYKSIIVVTGSDRLEEFQLLLKKYNGVEYNFNSIKVESGGDRDPDSEDIISNISATKIREYVKNYDMDNFISATPKISTQMTNMYFNDIRTGLGLDIIDFNKNIKVSDIREQFFNGTLINIGDIVTDNNGIYEVIEIGANFVKVINESGNIFSKWPNKLSITDTEIKPNYFISTKVPDDIIKIYNESIYNGASKYNMILAFNNLDNFLNGYKMGLDKTIKILAEENQLDKHSYIKDIEMKTYNEINNILAEDMQTADYALDKNGNKTKKHTVTFKGNSVKPKTAKIEEEIVYNDLTEEKYVDVKHYENMLKKVHPTAKVVKSSTKPDTHYGVVGNKYVGKCVTNSKSCIGTIHEDVDFIHDQVPDLNDYEIVDNTTIDHTQAGIDLLDSITDEELQEMADFYYFEDNIMLDAYDISELVFYNTETNEIEPEAEDLDEVLSKAERIKSRIRFARTESKRERKLEIALKRKSSMQVLGHRARRLAVSILKKRFIKKPLNTLTVSEKERIEARIEKQKPLLTRLALKLIPKVKEFENTRLFNKLHTKEA